MDYDTARAQFLAATARRQTPIHRVRAKLASINTLRQAFDRTYGRAYVKVHSSRTVRARVAPYLNKYPDIMFSPTGSGFSQVAEVRMLADAKAITSKDVLVIGAEYGSEVRSIWGPHTPHGVVGIDIGDYESAWSDFYAGPEADLIPLKFVKMDAAALGFRDQSFDLIYSQGVLPHVTNVPDFLANSARVLRPGGIFYAFGCPLWSTYGGSHVHALAYDHLHLSDPELLRKAKELEDGSFWWLEQGLFNKLRFSELLKLISDEFEIVRVGIVESPDARRFRKTHPDQWQQLLSEHDEEDLMIRLTSFTARKRG